LKVVGKALAEVYEQRRLTAGIVRDAERRPAMDGLEMAWD